MEDVVATLLGTRIRPCLDRSIEMLCEIIPQEETEITEVIKLVAFWPPLCFSLFAPVPLSSRTAHGVSS